MENDFISYLDENGEKKDSSVTIISTSDGFVKFKTLQNSYLTIPSHRVLKIKQRIDIKGESDGDNTE